MRHLIRLSESYLAPYWFRHNIFGIVCVFLLFLFSSLRLILPDIAEFAGTFISLSGLFLALFIGKGIRATAPFWLLLAALAVQLISWTSGYFHHPEWISATPQLDRLGKWFLFIGVAWWLGGSFRLTLFLWGAGVTGFVASVLFFDNNYLLWIKGLSGIRVDFGIRNAQHAALFFGTALIGLLCFSSRLLAAGKLSFVRRLVWLFFTAVCLIGVVITQTRAVWLAIFISLFVLAVLIFLAVFVGRDQVRVGRSLLFGLFVAITSLLVAGLGLRDVIEHRVELENSIILDAVDGNWKEAPISSVGNRLLSWRASFDWIYERPIVGWGEEARGLVIEHTPWLPPQTKNNFGHLHNTFLELVVSYGVLGLGVILCLILWVGVGTWRAWRAGVMPHDMALFSIAYFLFYFSVNQFESYGFFWTGTYLQALVLGGVVTQIWRWQLEYNSSVFSFRSRKAGD